MTPPSLEVAILIEFAEIELAAAGRYFIPPESAGIWQEVIDALRRRHPNATIVGEEINGLRVIRSPDHLGRKPAR